MLTVLLASMCKMQTPADSLLPYALHMSGFGYVYLHANTICSIKTKRPRLCSWQHSPKKSHQHGGLSCLTMVCVLDLPAAKPRVFCPHRTADGIAWDFVVRGASGCGPASYSTRLPLCVYSGTTKAADSTFSKSASIRGFSYC